MAKNTRGDAACCRSGAERRNHYENRNDTTPLGRRAPSSCRPRAETANGFDRQARTGRRGSQHVECDERQGPEDDRTRKVPLRLLHLPAANEDRPIRRRPEHRHQRQPMLPSPAAGGRRVRWPDWRRGGAERERGEHQDGQGAELRPGRDATMSAPSCARTLTAAAERDGAADNRASRTCAVGSMPKLRSRYSPNTTAILRGADARSAQLGPAEQKAAASPRLAQVCVDAARLGRAAAILASDERTAERHDAAGHHRPIMTLDSCLARDASGRPENSRSDLIPTTERNGAPESERAGSFSDSETSGPCAPDYTTHADGYAYGESAISHFAHTNRHA